MSSTDPKEQNVAAPAAVDDSTADRARAFFREQLVPVAERLRARGVEFFPKGPTEDDPSWWVPYRVTREQELDEALPTVERLAAMWKGDPELAALAAPLLELAREIQPAQTEKSEVSPFVYVMF